MITNKNKEFLARYGSLAHVDELMKTPDGYAGHNYAKAQIAKNPIISDEHLSNLANHRSYEVRKHVINNPNAKSEHIDSALKAHTDPYSSSKLFNAVLNSPVVTSNHISHMIHLLDDRTSETARYHLVKRILDHHAKRSRNIDELVSHPDDIVREATASHKSLTSDHIDKLSNDHDWEVRSEVASNPNIQEHQLRKLITDDDDGVKDAAHHFLEKRFGKTE